MQSRLFTDEQLEKLAKKTPKGSLQEHQTLGGQTLTGVDWSYFKNLLNEILGVGNWGYEPQMEHVRFEQTTSNHPSCSVPVTCYIYGQGTRVRDGEECFYHKTDDTIWECTNVGTAYYQTKMLQGDLIKAAIADGVKKTFSILGFCQDVYEGKTVLAPKANEGKKKNPRTGTSKIKSAEDKAKVKEAKKALKELKDAVQTQLKEKQEAGEKLTDLGEKALKFDTSVFIALANEALIKAVGEGDSKVDFNINEKVKSQSDLFTLYEWKLALDLTRKWFNFVLIKEGLKEAEDDKKDT